ncbi:MAG: HEPN domain-containing protein [bacterium]
MKNRTDLVKDWLKKAENDLKIALHALENMESPPTDAICFHAQQCAEKYLKAFLVHKEITFPYIHQLERLALLCATEDKGFESLTPDVKLLTPYAIETRYPDYFIEIPLEKAREAVKTAQKVKSFVLDRLPEVLG